jgi:hypothetical protein
VWVICTLRLLWVFVLHAGKFKVLRRGVQL